MPFDKPLEDAPDWTTREVFDSLNDEDLLKTKQLLIHGVLCSVKTTIFYIHC